ARITKSHGPVTNVLLTNGSLKVGDYIICGKYYGKVRAMHNDLGKNVKTAGPSKPVEIFGIQGVPNAADRFYVVSDEKTARKISEQKIMQEKQKELNVQLTQHMSLESLHDKMTKGERVELKIILKADVQGSVEVVTSSLQKLSSDKVTLNIVHSGVGGINESDVMLATVSDAIIIGFHVKANMKAQALAERERIDLRFYTIIYEATQDIKTAMEGRLAPTFKEVNMGMTEVREIFKASKIGMIGGCLVLKGKISRSHKIRVLRNDVIVYEGSLSSLKRFKDDAREVKDGFECGLTVHNFNDLKVGDMIESYIQEAVATKL
ncbi:translation initiation factor IF-2, partial [Candidatus Omnitrophota bacterium]